MASYSTDATSASCSRNPPRRRRGAVCCSGAGRAPSRVKRSGEPSCRAASRPGGRGGRGARSTRGRSDDRLPRGRPSGPSQAVTLAIAAIGNWQLRERDLAQIRLVTDVVKATYGTAETGAGGRVHGRGAIPPGDLQLHVRCQRPGKPLIHAVRVRRMRTHQPEAHRPRGALHRIGGSHRPARARTSTWRGSTAPSTALPVARPSITC